MGKRQLARAERRRAIDTDKLRFAPFAHGARLLLFAACLIVAPCAPADAAFRLVDDADAGAITVFDGETPVLTYRYGMQLAEGVDAKYERSCYIHPLYDLDGKPMTDDFPRDHFHHRGVFWTWPRMKARGKDVQTWHPSDPPLRQHFSKWLAREANDDAATLDVENTWKLDDEHVVATSRVTMVVHPIEGEARAIDLALRFEAVGGPVELLGAAGKGYGGLCLRSAPPYKDGRITTSAGPLKGDSTNKPFAWADLSHEGRGVAIFVANDHPDYPPTWLLRTSYAGILNVSWPGLKPHILEPGQPVTLRYRLLIHRGAADALPKAYERYTRSAP